MNPVARLFLRNTLVVVGIALCGTAAIAGLAYIHPALAFVGAVLVGAVVCILFFYRAEKEEWEAAGKPSPWKGHTYRCGPPDLPPPPRFINMSEDGAAALTRAQGRRT